MPVFLKHGKSVLFVHIPKAGGTSVERMFQNDGWEMQLHNARPMYRRCSPQHMHGEILAERVNLAYFDAIFGIVREPIARFRSEYAMRVELTDNTISAKVVERWADNKIRQYQSNNYALDNHLRPQHEFMVPNISIFRFEDGLENVPEWLNERFDIDITSPIPHSMNSQKRSGRSSREVQISQKLSAKLKTFYELDFNYFNY
ncbi:sulfotransferase family 2 domain-containing protein [Brevibacterium litoralis]|uniref:sulfotransferase family 2 domain-containing protein n=1 Tax=Brevibacterium litoralis TaxID=3138935 RepID=UPI0032EAA87F